ncbi:MAG: FAD-dependent oxidoreductase [Firmicutes bacterium]|nr:FAD-dependent oxidoreductase [Bacillota bacterium]
MKVIVIGCTHSGTAAVKNIKKLYKEAEVTVYERNDNISFLSCGIALYVMGVVKDPQGLFYSSPKELSEMGVNTKMQHEVEKIDFETKKVYVKDLVTNSSFEDYYDKLVIATGSWPIIPRIEGITSSNVLLSKNYGHSNEIIAQAKGVKKITVVGAGYIGVELAEAFAVQGKEVTLIDAESRIMPKYLDPEFTNIAEEAFRKGGIKLALGEMVSRFETEEGLVSKVVTNKGSYETELVIMCIGFRPNTKLFEGGIEMNKFGAIIVDEYMQTSRKEVFACGDAATVHYNPTNETRYIPLATNAVRMGTLVARNLVKPTIKSLGTQGTSGIQIYEYSISSTGLTEIVAKEMNINYGTVTIKDNDRPEFMPEYVEVMLKIVFDKDSRQLLGGQILSKKDVTQNMNTLSVCIQNKMTVEDLAFVDFFFQPNFNKPWNLLNLAGLAALDVK